MWSSVSLHVVRRAPARARRRSLRSVDQRLLVEDAGEVERAVEKDLGLADADEQRVVLVGDGRGVEARATRRPARSRRAPGTRRGRRLGHGDAQLRMQLGVGRRVEELREQAVDLGAGQLLAARRASRKRTAESGRRGSQLGRSGLRRDRCGCR